MEFEPDNKDRWDKIRTNRLTGIERQGFRMAWGGRLARFFSAKAFLFPFVVVVVAGAIFAAVYWSQSSGQNGESKNAKVGQKLPELPAGNKDLTQGKTYYLKGWYPAAQSAFERVLNSDAPDDHKAIALTYLAMIAYDQEQYTRSIDYLKRALKYNDDDPIIYRNMALAYRNRGIYGEAVKMAQKALELNPEDSKNHILLGNLYFAQKNYKKAQQSYAQGLEQSPHDPLLLYNYGLALMQQGKVPEAVEAFQKAADKAGVGKVAIQANANLGRLFAQRKEWDKAISYMTAATKLAPKDGGLLYELGEFYRRAGRQKKALEVFEKALVQGGSPAIYEKLGDTYKQLNLVQEGIKAYSKALNQGNDKNLAILSKLAHLYYVAGDYKKAEEYNRKIISLAPGSSDARHAYMQLGNILDDVQRYDQAVEMYRKAANLDPTDEVPWINMALSHQKNNSYGKAIKAYKRAISINPDNPKPRMGLGRLYESQGYLDEALDEYIHLLQIQKDYPPAHFEIAKLYQRKGKRPEAIDGYKKVIELKPKGKDGQEMVYKSYLNLALITAQKADARNDARQEEDFAQAVSYAKKTVQMRPENPRGLYVLGEVYLTRKDAGDLAQARETFEQVVAMPEVDAKLRSRAYNGLGKSYFREGKYLKAIRAFGKALKHWSGNEEAALNRKSASARYEKSLTR
jgi:superkiller protein 3